MLKCLVMDKSQCNKKSKKLKILFLQLEKIAIFETFITEIATFFVLSMEEGNTAFSLTELNSCPHKKDYTQCSHSTPSFFSAAAAAATTAEW